MKEEKEQKEEKSKKKRWGGYRAKYWPPRLKTKAGEYKQLQLIRAETHQQKQSQEPMSGEES